MAPDGLKARQLIIDQAPTLIHTARPGRLSGFLQSALVGVFRRGTGGSGGLAMDERDPS
jgi:hypothetical protein